MHRRVDGLGYPNKVSRRAVAVGDWLRTAKALRNKWCGFYLDRDLLIVSYFPDPRLYDWPQQWHMPWGRLTIPQSDGRPKDSPKSNEWCEVSWIVNELLLLLPYTQHHFRWMASYWLNSPSNLREAIRPSLQHPWTELVRNPPSGALEVVALWDLELVEEKLPVLELSCLFLFLSRSKILFAFTLRAWEKILTTCSWTSISPIWGERLLACFEASQVASCIIWQ